MSGIEIVLDEGVRAQAVEFATRMHAEGRTSGELPLDGSHASAWLSQNPDDLLATLGQINVKGTIFYLGIHNVA